MVSPARMLLDTVFAVALLNRRDSLHPQARKLFPKVKDAAQIWVTEAVLTEIANSLTAANRGAAATFIKQCYRAPNIEVVSVDSALFMAGFEKFQRYGDKTWGLTDCISFVVMEREGLTAALTCDEHFVQAGFRTLLDE